MSDERVLWLRPVIGAETEWRGVAAVLAAVIARWKTKPQNQAAAPRPPIAGLPAPIQSYQGDPEEIVAVSVGYTAECLQPRELEGQFLSGRLTQQLIPVTEVSQLRPGSHY